MKSFDFTDLEDIIRGSHFYASGGGGAYENGLVLLNKTKEVLEKKGMQYLQYYDAGDVELEEKKFYAPFVGAVGSPAKYLKEGFVNSPVWAYDLHEKAMNDLSRQGQQGPDAAQVEFDSVIPIETGTITFGMAMLLAAQKGKPIMNMDGCGRAVPVLPMVGPAQPVVDAPDLSPVALVSETSIAEGGAQLIINTSSTENLNSMMHGIISDDKGFDERSAMSCYATSGTEMSRAAAEADGTPGFMVVDSLQRARRLGAALRQADGNEQKALQAVLEHSGGIKVVSGQVSDVQDTHRNGFDFLEVTLTDAAGTVYKTQAENETLLLERIEDDGKRTPLVMGPDLLCFLRDDGLTLTNSEIAALLHERQEAGKTLGIHVIAVPAVQCMNTLHMQSLFLTELSHMGYDGPFISPFQR